MKRYWIALLVLATLSYAEEEGEEGAKEGEGEEAKPPAVQDPRDAQQLLKELIEANAAKDPAKIGALQAPIANIGKTSKVEADIDALAAELAKSLHMKDLDLQGKVVDTLGELRSKKSAGALKKIAFAKKTEGEKEEQLKAKALLAIAALRDPGSLEDLSDQAKDRSVIVAKAACDAFKHYATAKGGVRMRVAEALMKRLDAEYPAAGQGGKVSEDQRKRWNDLSPVIVASMQAVSRQNTIVDIENWREWWKENKKNPKAWRDEES